MRAVALADPEIQQWITNKTVPLKVRIEPGTERFPLNWQAFIGWSIAYSITGGKDNQGFTGCSVVSPDKRMEYANTGSAMVWELFDSAAYDRVKFLSMLARGHKRHLEFLSIQQDSQLNIRQRNRKMTEFRVATQRLVAAEGRGQLPPKGFSIENAKELFRMSGDLDD